MKTRVIPTLLAVALGLSLPSGYAQENSPAVIVNASFEDGLTGWTLETGGAGDAAGIAESGRADGSALSVRAAEPYTARIYQRIENVAPGDYSMTLYAQSGGGQSAAYAYAHGTEQGRCKTAVPPANALNAPDGWVKITVRGIEVAKDGVLTIGIYCDAQANQWMKIDDIQLRSEQASMPFLIGGDVSQLTYVEDAGAVFYDRNGHLADALQILAENGWNIVRLRLYNDPGKGRGDGAYYCREDYMNPADILSLSKRAADKGMATLISFHYSDFWSNGATQIIPQAWREAIAGMDDAQAVDALERLVYAFTLDYMQKLAAQGTLPLYVSLGNETQGGMLFPYGKPSVEGWPNLARFYAAGYRAVKEVSPDTQVVIHLDDAGNDWQYETYFDNCRKYGAPFDVIGISYYPFFTKRSVAEITDFCDRMTERYACALITMETGYNWNPARPDGWTGQLADNGCYDGIYPSSPEGQRAFLDDVFRALKNVRGGMNVGDLYWDPIFVAQEGVGWAMREDTDAADVNVVSNTTLFDFEHKALPALFAYRDNGIGARHAVLSGKLVGAESGAPLAYVAVRAEFAGETYNAVTDAYGGFILHTPARAGLLAATAEGLTFAGDGVSVQTELGEVTKCVIAMRGGDISGRVTDENGSPVENAEVSAKGDAYDLSVKTDADGRYLLADLPSGGYTVSARADGCAVDTAPFQVDCAVGATVADMDIRVTRTSGAMTGFVVDETGAPIVGATVTASGGDEALTAVTDTSGAFTLPAVPAGFIYRVLAKADAYHEKETVVAVSVGEKADAGRLILSRALGALRGMVVDRHGKPIADARVTATHASGVLYNAVTDAEGHYLLENIPSGDYTVLSVKDGLPDGEVSSVSVVSGQTIDAGAIVQPEPVALVNPGFETQGEQYTDAEGWNIVCTRSDINGPACFRQDRTYFGGAQEGVFGLGIWLDQAFTADASQRVTNLAAGSYALDAYVYSGVTGHFTMYVKDTNGVIIAERAIGLSSGHVRQSLPFELAAGGDVVIGFAVDTIGGDWAVVDRVSLGAY